MKTTIRFLVAAVLLMAVASPAGAAVITWTNTAGGDWDDAASWSPNQLPGPGDDAMITANGIYTVTLSAVATVGTLTIGGAGGQPTLSVFFSPRFTINGPGMVNTGATLLLSGPTLFIAESILTIDGQFTDRALMSSLGPVTIDPTGQMTIDDSVAVPVNETLLNFGLINLESGDLQLVSSGCGGQGQIINSPTGTIEFSGDVSIDELCPGATLINSGQIEKVAGTGASTISPMLINTGTVFTQTGTIDINGPNSIGSGTFQTSNNATLNISTNFIDLGATFSGAGSNIFGGGTFTAIGPITVANLIITNGTFVPIGDVTFSNVQLAGGTLEGTNAVIDGTWSWTGGNIGASNNTLTIDTNGILDISGLAQHPVYGILTNAGSIVVEQGELTIIGSECGGAGEMVNLPGATIDLQGDVSILPCVVDAAFLVNEGTVEKTQGTGTSYLNVTLDNTGTVWAQTGTIDVNANDTVNSAGAFQTSSGANVDFVSDYTIYAGTQFTGDGSNFVTGGNFTITNASVANLTLQSGNILLEGTVIFSNSTLAGANLQSTNGGQLAGQLIWTSGTNGAGGLTIASNGMLSLQGDSNSAFYVEGDLVNMGTLQLAAGTLVLDNCSGSGQLQNPGGVIDFTGDATIASCGSVFPTLNSSGTIEKTGGTGTSSINVPLANGGTVAVESGTLALNTPAGSTPTNTGTFQTAAGAALDFNGNVNFQNADPFTGAGSNVFNSIGTMTLIGPATVANTIFSNGTVVLTNAITFSNTQLAGATLTGTNATIAGNLTWLSGVIGTGALLDVASNGVLTLAGDSNATYALDGALTNAGTIEIESGNLQMAGLFCVGVSVGSLVNLPSGAIELLGDVNIESCGLLPQLNNEGTVEKLGGTGVSVIAPVLNNTGIISAQTGQLQLGDVSSFSTGTVEFGIGGPTSYGSIYVSNVPALAGAISVNFQNGYIPSNGASFEVLTAPLLSGTFSNVDLPALTQSNIWQITYGMSNVTLAVVSPATFTTQITGSVTNASGTGVGGLTVFAVNTNSNTNAIFTTTTGVNGGYALNVPNGTFDVGLENLLLAGYAATPDQFVTINNASAVVNFGVSNYAGSLFTVTATTSPAGAGTITGAGSYLPGTPAALTVTPNLGPILPYVFVDWTENGVVLTNATVLDLLVNTDHNLVANFIYPSPAISNQPQNEIEAVGDLVTFSVNASGPSLAYQWQYNGTDLTNGPGISGAMSSSLTISALATNEIGGYQVIISNAYGSVTSAMAGITLAFVPTITTAPSNIITLGDHAVELSVTAAGTAPLAYQWLLDGGPLAGQTASNLVFAAATTNDSGSYAVVITNLYGSITSSLATLTVLTNPSLTVMKVIVGQGGKVSPNDNGKTLVVSNKYTMTATPSNGWLFAGWQGTVATNTAKLTFVMQDNMVEVANFISNLFLTAQGSYNGLFEPTNAVRDQTNSGAFNLSVTTAGSYSGKLTLGTNSISLSGKFDITGATQDSVAKKGQPAVTTTLQLDPDNRTVSGLVTDGSFMAVLSGYQSVFNAKDKATNYQGTYTLALPGVSDPAVGPFGASYGTVTVKSTGALSFAGALADGVSVTQSSTISSDGFWPLYLSLYKGAGSLWSWTQITNGEIIAVPAASWINCGNSAKGALYPSGFTNQNAALDSSPYNAAAKPPLNLTNATVLLQGGGLLIPLTNQIALASGGKITLTTNAGNTNKLTLTINKTTGVISGSFANPENPKKTIKVSGALMQNATNATGYFPGANQSGLFLIQAP